MRRLIVLGIAVATLALAVGGGTALGGSAAPTAAAAAAKACKVPELKGSALAGAKKLLTVLNCKVGKVKRAPSRRVPKGIVIGTRPKAGTYKGGQVVTIIVSSGKQRRGG